MVNRWLRIVIPQAGFMTCVLNVCIRAAIDGGLGRDRVVLWLHDIILLPRHVRLTVVSLV